jgi:hypothetical protein
VRIVGAQILRVVSVAAFAAAAVTTLITLAGLILIAAGRVELARYGIADLLVAWLVTAGVLLAVSRLAHLGIRALVDIRDPDQAR